MLLRCLQAMATLAAAHKDPLQEPLSSNPSSSAHPRARFTAPHSNPQHPVHEYHLRSRCALRLFAKGVSGLFFFPRQTMQSKPLFPQIETTDFLVIITFSSLSLRRSVIGFNLSSKQRSPSDRGAGSGASSMAATKGFALWVLMLAGISIFE